MLKKAGKALSEVEKLKKIIKKLEEDLKKALEENVDLKADVSDLEIRIEKKDKIIKYLFAQYLLILKGITAVKVR